MKSLLQFLDGNNRIIAIAILLLVGGVNAAFGVDLGQYANMLLALIGFDGSWLAEVGIKQTPAEVTYAAYAFVAILRALYKRAKGLPDRPAAPRPDVVSLAGRTFGVLLALALVGAAPAAAQSSTAHVSDLVGLAPAKGPAGDLKLVGTITFEVRDAAGDLKEVRRIRNLVTDAGKAGIASRINGAGSEAAFGHIAIGTGTTAAAAGDTTLQTEISTGGGARAACTASRVTTDVTNDTAQCVVTFSFTASFAVTESGYLNAASAGVLLARQVFSAINVANGDSLQVTWKIDVD